MTKGLKRKSNCAKTELRIQGQKERSRLTKVQRDFLERQFTEMEAFAKPGSTDHNPEEFVEFLKKQQKERKDAKLKNECICYHSPTFLLHLMKKAFYEEASFKKQLFRVQRKLITHHEKIIKALHIRRVEALVKKNNCSKSTSQDSQNAVEAVKAELKVAYISYENARKEAGIPEKPFWKSQYHAAKEMVKASETPLYLIYGVDIDEEPHPSDGCDCDQQVHGTGGDEAAVSGRCDEDDQRVNGTEDDGDQDKDAAAFVADFETLVV